MQTATVQSSSKQVKRKASPLPVVEEQHFRNESAYLCALINRRAKSVRVIDYRAGILPAKRTFIQSLLKKEGIRKVLLLVEKDEVSSWTRMGFVREGSIPGFYKRSDGYIVGCVMTERGDRNEVSDEAAKRAEKTLQFAKKHGQETVQIPRGVHVAEVPPETALKARDQAWAKGIALGTFDPFGRDGVRVYFEFAPAKGKPNYWSTEFQDWFGHSLVEILRSPTTDDEIAAASGILYKMGEEFLKPRGIVSAFGLAPIDDLAMARVYYGAGYRKTGILCEGLQVGSGRTNAILWTKKLANPDAEDEDFN